MNYCAKKAGTELKLGRDGSSLSFRDYESKFRKDGSQFYPYRKIKIYGREIVDTFFLAIRYDVGRKYPSYGLKAIIDFEGLQVEGRQFYDASKIKDNYKDPEEWEKIKKYAEHDADDSLAVYDLMISPYFYMAQSIPKCFQEIICGAAGSQINSILVRAYLQDGHSIPKKSESEKFEGAISLGNPGVYSHVLKVDVASLYPSIMLQYEICDQEKDPNRYFLKMVQYFTEERLKNKALAKDTGKKEYDDLQAAQKILINSMYGFMGANELNFNSPKKAALVTEKGREILSKGMQWVEDKGYQLVNVDTDSFSYTKGREVSKKEFDADIEEINTMYPEKIKWEDDGYYKKVIVIKAKNYVLDDGKKVKYKGSAITDQKKEPALTI
jgi:DNA polymerase elongation subunit (family B)